MFISLQCWRQVQVPESLFYALAGPLLVKQWMVLPKGALFHVAACQLVSRAQLAVVAMGS